MNQKTKDALKSEVQKFSVTGISATAVDFVLLNIGVLLLHLPLLIANIFSTSLASIVSFLLNRNVVFDGQRHNYTRTITLFAIITAVGIYGIQSIVLYLVGDKFDGIARTIIEASQSVHIQHLSGTFISVNLAKVVASALGAIWNFFMLRRFVFVPTNEPDTKSK